MSDARDRATTLVLYRAGSEVRRAPLALEPGTGKLVAMVGGYDFERSKFNRATQSIEYVPVEGALVSGYDLGGERLIDKAGGSYATSQKDGTEGVAAFRARRAPSFRGR